MLGVVQQLIMMRKKHYLIIYCENFGTECDYDLDPKGDCWYSNIRLGEYHYKFSNRPPDNCTEITFQQFKDYVLREKPSDDSDLEAIYLKLLQ